MFLKHKITKELVEIISIEDMYDPCMIQVLARSHGGEEMQEPWLYAKQDLIFPSGESLPRCWLDPHYSELKLPEKVAAIAIS